MNATSGNIRGRLAYSLAAVGVVGLGLIWRSPFLPLSPFMKKYGGDALWAALIFTLIRFCWPRMEIVTSASFAFGIAVVVELSQLYDAPWIDTMRGFRLGALILGSTFNWPDIPAYALGIILGALLDRGWRTQQRKS